MSYVGKALEPMKIYTPKHGMFPVMLHGGDYNPDQWIATPEVWDEDIRLMKLCHANCMSVGIFSWAALEPEEGVFTFEWLDTIMDKLAANGMYAILATPSGARPRWLSEKYPEVLRVNEDGTRIHHVERHNHCYTSPKYRELVQRINTKLAERYAKHPALVAWHVSNEYGGECHCELCQEAFRSWLKEKYGSLDNLNEQWWCRFWANTVTDWSQLRSGNGRAINGLALDWKRFVTYQTVDFFKAEIEPLKRITPNIPVTANFMGTYDGLDYFKFAREVDIVSNDSYPRWHCFDTDETAAEVAFTHDLIRSMRGGQPWLLMESTPSMTNWQPVAKLKRPGMHSLSSIHAVAHGADSVQYFQWRKSRGSGEQWHGAVVDHVGHENTRVFRDVTEVGEVLTKLGELRGTAVPAKAAVIYDWENRWAFEGCNGFRNVDKDYLGAVISWYKGLRNRGINTAVIDEDSEFEGYSLIIAPMLYMLKPGVTARLRRFVENGGILMTTYISGYVNENCLAHLGGFPGDGLGELLGIWAEEIDCLTEADRNTLCLGETKKFEIRHYCELLHLKGAEALGTYGEDFYKGMPAVTVNKVGKGKAYHVGCKGSEEFIQYFTDLLLREAKVKPVMSCCASCNTELTSRTDGEKEYIFAMNFNEKETDKLLLTTVYKDYLTGERLEGSLELPPLGWRILVK